MTQKADETIEFSYRKEQFQEIAKKALQFAKKLGATNAVTEISEEVGVSVTVRKDELENVERNQDKSLNITTYVGQRVGHASTSDLSIQSVKAAVQAAYDIARFTAEDEFAGLADEHDLAIGASYALDLDLYHPWQISVDEAAELVLKAEQAAVETSPLITNSDGADLSTQQAHFLLANSRGFEGGYATSRHYFSVAPIAKDGDSMERDYWYSSARDAADLAEPEAVGRYAAERTLSRLNARQIPTCECPVLFESPLAAGLLGSFVQAVSGGSLYRRTSFLLEKMGKQVFAPHVFIDENPFIAKARGSSMFDAEGVATHARRVVNNGELLGYFLSSYSARKLGMKTTGHAGGSHNLRLGSQLTEPGDDLAGMIKKMGRGLFVTELIGQGVNLVTGDYSRGASGYWVEDGVIAYPVNEITIAGNLAEMFQQIVAIGADAYIYGSRSTGSILIEKMKIAGA